MKRALTVAAIWALSAGGGERSALAQDATQSAAPKVKVERSASGQKIFRITEGIVVEGQDPEAECFLRATALEYGLRLGEPEAGLPPEDPRKRLGSTRSEGTNGRIRP